jgi:hypothetical protein
MVSLFAPPYAKGPSLTCSAELRSVCQAPLALVTVAVVLLHLAVPVAAQGLTPEEIQRLVDSGKFNSKPVEPQQGSHPVRVSLVLTVYDAHSDRSRTRVHVPALYSCGGSALRRFLRARTHHQATHRFDLGGTFEPLGRRDFISQFGARIRASPVEMEPDEVFRALDVDGSKTIELTELRRFRKMCGCAAARFSY